ncbi:hypothetical protein M5K25_026634 [Dendrobium thyrsiflorum]|uniref:Uncharacterized protein n=1 Tax=Dendrobium thyrsiflorum TaxID=117978 RepID=A0ABD0TXU6_DENTH
MKLPVKGHVPLPYWQEVSGDTAAESLQFPSRQRKTCMGSSVPVKNVQFYIHSRLVVGVASGSLPTTLEKSMYGRFAGLPQTLRASIF